MMKNIHLRNFVKQVRKGAQVLRSFGKQNAHLLPTFLLMINHLGKNCEKRKNCAVRSDHI
jgi:hypothetical protein